MNTKNPLPDRNTILMCRPDYYGIEYEINPWMNRQNPAIFEVAQKQWEALYEILTKKLQLTVKLMDPRPNLPDLVFTANGGLVVGNKVFLSNFKYPERQGERKYFKEWFTKNNYETVSLPDSIAFEGEGDALWMRNILVAGYQFRSDISSHLFISQALQCEVLSLELIDPKYYHLDTCFCPIHDDLALFVPEAFSKSSIKILNSFINTLIPLKPDEAELLAANAIVTRRKIVIHHGLASLQKKLEMKGLEIFTIDLSEFRKAGGSAKCLILWL